MSSIRRLALLTAGACTLLCANPAFAERLLDAYVVDSSSGIPATPIRVLGLVAKNLAGVLLVLLGLIMAIPGVPGQGLLTAVIGITLLNLPGKLKVERRLLRIAALRPYAWVQYTSSPTAAAIPYDSAWN